jgi:hypothetical protein
MRFGYEKGAHDGHVDDDGSDDDNGDDKIKWE